MVGLGRQLQLMGLCPLAHPQPPKDEHKHTSWVTTLPVHADDAVAICVNVCPAFACLLSSRSSLRSNSLAELLKPSMFIRGSTFSPSPCLAIRPGTPKDMASQTKTNKSLWELHILHSAHVLFSHFFSSFIWSHFHSQKSRRNLLN